MRWVRTRENWAEDIVELSRGFKHCYGIPLLQETCCCLVQWRGGRADRRTWWTGEYGIKTTWLVLPFCGLRCDKEEASNSKKLGPLETRSRNVVRRTFCFLWGRSRGSGKKNHRGSRSVTRPSAERLLENRGTFPKEDISCGEKKRGGG